MAKVGLPCTWPEKSLKLTSNFLLEMLHIKSDNYLFKYMQSYEGVGRKPTDLIL